MKGPRSAMVRGALVGMSIGVVVAIVLLLMGLIGGDSKSMEGAAILASIVSWPKGMVFGWFDWGGYSSQWPFFIAIAPPLNGLVLGGAVGAIVGGFSRRHPSR